MEQRERSERSERNSELNGELPQYRRIVQK